MAYVLEITVSRMVPLDELEPDGIRATDDDLERREQLEEDAGESMSERLSDVLTAFNDVQVDSSECCDEYGEEVGVDVTASAMFSGTTKVTGTPETIARGIWADFIVKHNAEIAELEAEVDRIEFAVRVNSTRFRLSLPEIEQMKAGSATPA